MRLAVVTDIHGNIGALEAVAADIRRRGADRVVNLGDSLSGPLFPRETAQFLMTAGWTSIAGNQERQMLTRAPEDMSASDAYACAQIGSMELNWLRSQPPCLRLTSEVFLCHGTPASDLVYFLESVADGRTRRATRAEIEERLGDERAPLVLCGHTHIPRAVRSVRGQTIVNPGGVGLQAYDDTHPVPHVVETGSPDARYAIVERQPDGWSAALIAVPYDHRAMAHQARAQGRPDWERALLTGYLR